MSLIATCTPNSYPREEGLVEHGFQINVLDQNLAVLATVNLPDWETFRQEETGQHLADAGFTVSTDGWSPASLGYTASVVVRSETAERSPVSG